jgi:hypothetical protein
MKVYGRLSAMSTIHTRELLGLGWSNTNVPNLKLEHRAGFRTAFA